MVRVLVTDDETLARQRLVKLLETIDGVECVGEADNGERALAQIEALNPDVVLLDIRMPGVDGMEAARRIVKDVDKYHCKVVFTTAYDEYAIDAFDVNAIGYLLKPVSRQKLQQVLEKVSAKADKPDLAKKQHLSASSRGKVELIPVDNVRLLLAEHKYVTVYHTQGESILDESLKMLEQHYPDLFKRVHRNALVAVDYVEALERNTQGQYELRIADIDYRPAVSRRLVTDVRNWMKGL